MSSISKKTRVRSAIAVVAILALGAAVVWASTDVTITKTDSATLSAFQYDGTYYRTLSVQDLGSYYRLFYAVYTLSPFTIVEQGNGILDSSEFSLGGNGASLDVDTTDMVIVGSGGIIEVDWLLVGETAYSSSSKVTTVIGDTKTIRFSGFEQESAVAEGSYFGEDFNGTGAITTSNGKQIVQIKD